MAMAMAPVLELGSAGSGLKSRHNYCSLRRGHLHGGYGFFSLSHPAAASSSTPLLAARWNHFLLLDTQPLQPRRNPRTAEPRRRLVVTSVIKRRKDFPLDAVIQRQKKLKLVMKIKDLLIKQSGMVMSLKHLGKFRKELGLTGKRRVVALLRKYPGVFEVFEEGISALYFRFTPEAEDHILEEQKLRAELEDVLVTKIRRMLMMSIDKTLLLSKIDHLKKDLGLPNDYRTTMVNKYPQFFKVIETEGGLALELTSWDPELAISAWEKQLQSGPPPDDSISGRPRRFPKVDLPSGYSLKRKDIENLRKFQAVPFVSPYAEFSHIHPSSKEAEKHSCAVVHEILTLTLEKRTLIDHLTHFRKDFKFSQQIHGMLIRHPELFYVSLKGERDSVFLRQAYNGSHLIDKDPLIVAREKLARLIALGKHRDSRLADINENESDYESDGEDDWSDDEGEGDTQENEEKEALERLERHRELRRPLHILQREKAMATQPALARERW